MLAGVLGVAHILQTGQSAINGGLLLVGQGEELVQVGQSIEGPVEALGPVCGDDLEAFDIHALAVNVLSCGGGVVDALGGLFGNELCLGSANLVGSVGIGGQHGIVGNEYAQAGVVHCDPLNGVGQAVHSIDLEDVGLQIPVVADGADVVVGYCILNGEGVRNSDVGVP